ncbi:FAD-binding and (Fe-S)-binding domain-containing protein [Antrihabitans sp. YC2-6]|uniref:FAD-binding and (Fe-S)-binding domain-containing protein n=1 Tax=Antrihabitans sp. YC2-6 TaxID=2799498 RepID=UPI0018F51E36|nr:FAD-binding and (Fe-S)-binding domain-containing protein [Antrihabitans sp. YC2-6]MBJ8346547.1 FAD-binding oxidoreductase [Antrihabitans sp. YC2-6]
MSDSLDVLRASISGVVDDSLRRRAEYSSDASNYRVVPTAVVFPHDGDDVAATLEFARSTGLSVTARGAGTSVAGNAIGPGLVLDFSKHMNQIVEIDPEARTAVVQPGVVLGTLQRAGAPHGLRFGPDPSTQNRCTIGGMIGNNSCGPRAVAWGRTVDNVRGLRILDGSGTPRSLAADLAAMPGLERFVRANLGTIRTELGQFDRQASGYALEHLLPERGHNVAKAFVGTEGTCGVLLEATVDLVPVAPASVLAVLGYADMPTAAADVAALLLAKPLAIEGIDARLVDVVRSHRRSVPPLPRGAGWLFVEMAGSTVPEAVAAAESMCATASALEWRVVSDAAESAALWRIRADGAGLSGRTRKGEPAWPGWEDAAVPQEHLAAYLRDFDDLMDEHGVEGLLYGHFGDGCIHVRLDLPIAEAPQRFRSFLIDAATLVAKYGGSLSGEHGDGRARSELLPLMYSPQALSAFAGFKAVFDPDNLLNPGVLVAPSPIDVDLRLASVAKVEGVGGFSLSDDRGDISMAVHRCVGVGKCRADSSATGGFMCPSYLATKDEKDSTRGRARVLQEVVNGSLLAGGWSSEAVEESLDLCLSCKACASDCPAGVDMATYKSEALYRRYKGRRRPLDHYALGWLPRWLRVAKRLPRVANSLTGVGVLTRAGMRAAGMDPRRAVPELARVPFRRWWRDNRTNPADQGVLLWIDTFTDAFSPEVAIAAVELLEHAGYRVRITEKPVCCGLTWISTGQLDGARKRLRATLAALEAHVTAGGIVVGLEPSCTAVLRSDLVELLPDDPRAKRVADATRTLAEFLTDAEWSPPRSAGLEAVVQPHCHQHAVTGFGPDRQLLEAAGVHVTEISGCCGLAGNFGMELGHYDVSVAIAENGLLPALRGAQRGSVFIADGFSCRTQGLQLGGRNGVHLAQILWDAVQKGTWQKGN